MTLAVMAYQFWDISPLRRSSFLSEATERFASHRVYFDPSRPELPPS